jgi:nitrogen regulatory protein PII
MQLTSKPADKTTKKSAPKTAKPRKPAVKKTAPVGDGFRKLKLLITVVNRSKTEFFMDLLTAYEVNLQTAVLAQGTATNETLHILGLEDSDKSVIFSVIREDKAEEALHAIEDKFSTLKRGKGIAFTVPMSSVIGVAMYRFLSNHRA